jgi:hypothetical protein
VPQVTAASVRLVSGSSGRLLDEWKAPAGQSISVASSSPTQVSGAAAAAAARAPGVLPAGPPGCPARPWHRRARLA